MRHRLKYGLDLLERNGFLRAAALPGTRPWSGGQNWQQPLGREVIWRDALQNRL